MDGIEFGKSYTIRRPRQTSTVFSLQYNFKPPIDESKGGSAIVKEAASGEEQGTTWELRLPAVELSGERKAGWEDSAPSHTELGGGDAEKGSSSSKGKKRVINDGDEEEDRGDRAKGKAHRQEIFHGASAPSKYEFLLTWDTDNLPKQGELVLEKVSSLVRLKHEATRQQEAVSDLVKSSIEANKKLKTLKRR